MLSMFWTKKVKVEIKTHCEFVPEEGWDVVPVCRDLKVKKLRR